MQGVELLGIEEKDNVVISLGLYTRLQTESIEELIRQKARQTGVVAFWGEMAAP